MTLASVSNCPTPFRAAGPISCAATTSSSRACSDAARRPSSRCCLVVGLSSSTGRGERPCAPGRDPFSVWLSSFSTLDLPLQYALDVSLPTHPRRAIPDASQTTATLPNQPKSHHFCLVLRQPEHQHNGPLSGPDRALDSSRTVACASEAESRKATHESTLGRFPEERIVIHK